MLRPPEKHAALTSSKPGLFIAAALIWRMAFQYRQLFTYLVPNIYYLFSAQNATGLRGNMTEAESIP